MEKKKISAFEFAITQIATPNEIHKFEARTKEEETQIRVDKLMNQAKRMHIQKASFEDLTK